MSQGAGSPLRSDSPTFEVPSIIYWLHLAWKAKWVVLLALAATSLAFFIQLWGSHSGSPNTVTYSQVFDLTFEGLSDGEFPDGSPFLLSDMVSPAVLGRVHARHDLGAKGLTLDAFRRAAFVEPYSPDFFDIRASYQSRLTSASTASDIAGLQDRMNTELSAAQSGAVRLGLQLPASQLNTTQAKAVLTDIADAWATRAVEERGVLQLDMPIYSARIFDQERFEELEYLLSIDLLLDNIELIKGNVSALKALPNAARVVDSETGLNLEDLEKAINDVADYDLRQIIDPINELGLTRNPQVVELYYRRQLNELALEQRRWAQRAEAIEKALNTFSRDEPGARSIEQTPGQGMSPQLGDAFLDRLVELSRDGDSQAFGQNLIRQKLTYEENALDASQRIARIEQTLDAIAASEASAEQNGDTAKLRAFHSSEVEAALPSMLEELRSYTRVAGRLHQALGRQASGGSSEILLAQANSFTTESASWLTQRDLYRLVAAWVLAGGLSLFGGVVFAHFRRSRLEAARPENTDQR